MTGNRDILIVGAGLAGLFLALKLAPRRCTVIALAPLGQAAASAWAQGGMAAALSADDNPELHAADTIAAGAGIVDPVVAQMIAENGPARVRDLLAMGVPFDRTPNGDLALSLEAAHSHPRVARVAGDLAGKAIMEALALAVAAAGHIELIDGVRALALLQDASGRIGGVLAQGPSGDAEEIYARETILCAGGSGGLYAITTNPKSSQGDAIAMAYRAGALVADPEFVQFHPTAIDIGRDPAPLATEALRGEGAKLVDRNGRAFMCDYHPDCELAPRDEVARAIHAERAAGRGAFLDCRAAVGDHFPEHFPTVFGACMSAGIDPRTAPIPVAPAMHYHMGGVASDLWGRTTLEGLSVCGESASTGAHGGNRLASNSLLEAVVFAERIARRLKDATLGEPGTATADTPVELPAEDLNELRKRMHSEAGVIRNAAGLGMTLDWLRDARKRVGWSRPLATAQLIVEAALARKESRGGHFRSDYPTSIAPERTFLRLGPDGAPITSHAKPEEPAE
ncbi:MAG: L-aspartate oxidase [Alphaproteobacteria bacterium]|nr:L-aspartate oxidase [Alphaproteobacteria bacterium]